MWGGGVGPPWPSPWIRHCRISKCHRLLRPREMDFWTRWEGRGSTVKSLFTTYTYDSSGRHHREPLLKAIFITKYMILLDETPNKRRVQRNAGSTRSSFK